MIIIPTYNEKENIAALVKQIRRVLPEIKIFFVDDNSPDGTAEEIRKLQKLDKNILLLIRPKRAGLGSAYVEAFKKVIDEDLSDFVISFDADLSHPPSVLPLIIEKLKTFPVVVGSRYLSGGNIKNWNSKRRFLSRGGNLYAKVLTGLPITDLTSGMVGYNVKVLKQIDLDSIISNSYAFQIEMKWSLIEAGQLICEIPITFTERRKGKSKLSYYSIFEGIIFPLKKFFKRIF